MEVVPAWFYACAITSSLLLVIQSVTWFRTRRQNRIFHQTHSCVKWLRVAHHVMCISFVTSTMVLLALKITCSRRHNIFQPLFETLLEVVMVFEIQSLIAEAICNMHLHRKCSKLSKLVLASSAVVLLAPIVATMFASMHELVEIQGAKIHDNFPTSTNSTLNFGHNYSTFTEMLAVNPKSTNPQIFPVTAIYQDTVKDPLLSLEPIIASKMMPKNNRLKSEIQDQLDLISKESGTTVGLYERILLIKYLEKLDAESVPVVCWIAWPSAKLLITYVIMSLSCFYGYVLSLKEYVRLRKVAKARMVPLESWLATVVRPTLITVTLLKWMAVSLEFHSHQCLYTVAVATSMAPILFPFVVGPKRCSRSGEMRRGFLSKSLLWPTGKTRLKKWLTINTSTNAASAPKCVDLSRADDHSMRNQTSTVPCLNTNGA